MQNPQLIYEIYQLTGLSYNEFCWFMSLCGCLFGFAFCMSVFIFIANLR
ncbi:hypothetical protein OFO01_06575 [Campylobacter sp. JMF_01 NE2]|nr:MULTISPECIES: hypothetical protein [unclassified Campylobacter]MDA3053114.1 hypothetical protein [Campylobacter sp. JMF_03 NE3]MDA3067445.1 hypothetical protein [Campylobacter sp. JMF_01 NE2]